MRESREPAGRRPQGSADYRDPQKGTPNFGKLILLRLRQMSRFVSEVALGDAGSDLRP